MLKRNENERDRGTKHKEQPLFPHTPTSSSYVLCALPPMISPTLTASSLMDLKTLRTRACQSFRGLNTAEVDAIPGERRTGELPKRMRWEPKESRQGMR